MAAFLALVMLSRAIVAQDWPDFSGTWVLIGPAAAVASETELDVRQEPRHPNGGPPPVPAGTLTITRRFTDARMTRDVVHVGAVGGRVGELYRDGRGTGPNGQVTRTVWSSSWIGMRLSVTKAEYNGPSRASGPYVERTEVWSLDGDGALVIRVEEQSSDKPPINETLRYRKK